MNTHDKIKLPPHDATANISGSPPVRLYSEAKVRAAIEAGRKQYSEEIQAHQKHISNLQQLIADLTEKLQQRRGEPVQALLHQARRVRNYSDPEQVFEAVPVSAFGSESDEEGMTIVGDGAAQLGRLLEEQHKGRGRFIPQPADPTIKESLTVAEPGKEPTDEDAKFLDWLSTHLFERKWDGTIGNPCEWHLRGDWRHTLQRMKGPDIRAAITQAMQQELFS